MRTIALIVQWIEQLRPKEEIWVRLLVRAQKTSIKNKNYFLFFSFDEAETGRFFIV